MSTTNPPKALLTDVFGTVVDWRTTVTDHLTHTAHETLNSPSKSLSSTVRSAASAVAWPAFAQLWRESYYHFTRSYSPSSTPFKSIDQHHCESLADLLRHHGLEGLWQDDEVKQLSMIWHFLTPWPDASPGLALLNHRFETATLSNGNTSLLADLASHGALPYKHIISAEDFKAYKPHPDVYNGAAKKLGLHPSECALVAAHLGDLHAAQGCGYQTIYIERPQEEGWDRSKVDEAKREGWVDMWVEAGQGGFEEVARRFGLASGPVAGGGLDRTGEEKQKIEQAAQSGVYYDDPAIAGSAVPGRGDDTQKRRAEDDAKKGIYPEDGSIVN